MYHCLWRDELNILHRRTTTVEAISPYGKPKKARHLLWYNRYNKHTPFAPMGLWEPHSTVSALGGRDRST
jgi:hypothetical protein